MKYGIKSRAQKKYYNIYMAIYIYQPYRPDVLPNLTIVMFLFHPEGFGISSNVKIDLVNTKLHMVMIRVALG